VTVSQELIHTVQRVWLEGDGGQFRFEWLRLRSGVWVVIGQRGFWSSGVKPRVWLGLFRRLESG